MAWSNWRGAVVLVLLGSVGLAWSQSPMFNRPASSSSSERIMTVHENGKALSCRVLRSWRTSAGSQAHQLQVIETGAMLTIVEDGQPTTVSQGSGTQVRALPMRIFHWSMRDRTPPAGAPVPPPMTQTVVTTAPSPAAPSAIKAVSHTQTPAAPVTTATPVVTSPGRGPRLAACTNCKERVISWEEGSRPATIYPGSTAVAQAGQPSGPVIVENSMPTIVESPRQPRLPRLLPPRGETVVVVPEKSGHSGVVNAAAVDKAQGQKTIITTTPVITAPRQDCAVKDAALIRPGKTTTIQSAEVVCDSEKSSVRDKLHNILNKPGTAKSNVIKPAEPRAVDDKVSTTLPALNSKKDDKRPFSTATAQPTATPKTMPLSIPSDFTSARKEARDDGNKGAVSKKDSSDWRKMWGKSGEVKLEQPGQSTIDREKVRKELPPASQTDGKRQDILMAPEKFNPANDKVYPKVSAELANLHMPQQPGNVATGNVPTPLGVQSVLSARNGVQGPVQYIPVPVAIVPEPVRPPTPPEPKLPEPPNPAAYVNAFSPPPPPQGQQQVPPPTPEQMQAIMQHQAMMQQQAYMQQLAMMQRMQNGQQAQLIPVGNGMPMQVRYPANYNGPQAPNPVAQQMPMSPVQQVGYPPAAQPFAGNPAMDRRVTPVSAQQPAGSDSNTLGQLINVLQNSPYRAQREWAAANLATFDHRVYPHVPQVLVQAARQDSAPTVRAAAVYSLSRMNVPSEVVVGTLQTLRGDADPRVRQEVEQAQIRMGLTPRQ